jgi:hypothetical protein
MLQRTEPAASRRPPQSKTDGRTRLGYRCEPALFVDAFRVLGGFLLSIHYARQVRFAPRFTEIEGLVSATSGSRAILELPSAWISRIGPHGAQAWLSLGTALAALVVLGLAPRVSAALLLIVSAITYHAVQPAAMLDDYFAATLAFWLTLLPTGRTLSLRTIRFRRDWAAERTSFVTCVECLLFILIALFELGLRDGNIPAFAQFGFLVAAACIMAPIREWRAVGGVLAVASVWAFSRVNGVLLALAATGAMCALLCAAVIWSWKGEPDKLRRIEIGPAAAIGGTAVVLLALQVLAFHVHVPSIARSTGTVLADAGLPGPWDLPHDNPSGAPLDIGFVSAQESRVLQIMDLDPNDRRLQVVARMFVRSPSMDSTRLTLIRRLVTRYCERTTPADGSPRQTMVVLRSGAILRRVVVFECGAIGEPPKMGFTGDTAPPA